MNQRSIGSRDSGGDGRKASACTTDAAAEECASAAEAAEIAAAAAAEEDALAHRARAGDPAALTLLYQRHAPALLAYLMRLLPQRADAEDVLQETFLRLIRGRGGYRGRGRFRPWLFTVATRVAIDHGRRRQRRNQLLQARQVPASAAARARAAEQPLQQLTADEIGRCIDRALATLPADYATAFHLRIQQGFSYREIAAITAAPAGTLRSRVHHALKAARQALRDAGFVPSAPSAPATAPSPTLETDPS
jgi:RNA polymerase sigma-70 factor (ECF subfamily)